MTFFHSVPGVERILLKDIIEYTSRIAYLLVVDIILTALNLFIPKRSPGRVINDKSAPGYGGIWPKYRKPTEEDSRSCCPALNALANHGIIPRSGRSIPLTQIDLAVRATFNISSSFSLITTLVASDELRRDYDTAVIDLSDLSAHNTIEHDASYTRADAAFSPCQSKPCVELIEGLLACATGPPATFSRNAPKSAQKYANTLTTRDFARYISRRRRDSFLRNPQYSNSLKHQFFGSANTAMLLTSFRGNTADLKTFLIEERIPDGWESGSRDYLGMTFTKLAMTFINVEARIRDERRK